MDHLLPSDGGAKQFFFTNGRNTEAKRFNRGPPNRNKSLKPSIFPPVEYVELLHTPLYILRNLYIQLQTLWSSNGFQLLFFEFRYVRVPRGVAAAEAESRVS
jgi:hypothetical protein